MSYREDFIKNKALNTYLYKGIKIYKYHSEPLSRSMYTFWIGESPLDESNYVCCFTLNEAMKLIEIEKEPYDLL